MFWETPAMVGGADFMSEVRDVVRDGRPSSGGDLMGMAMDVDAYLFELPELDTASIETARTGHAECLIRTRCRVAGGVTISQGAEAVRGAWLQDLRYSYREAHRVRVTVDSAVVEFVTQMGPGRLYVTGRIEILP